MTNSITIRGITPDLHHRLRIAAITRGITIGALYTMIAENWLRYESPEQPAPTDSVLDPRD